MATRDVYYQTKVAKYYEINKQQTIFTPSNY